MQANADGTFIEMNSVMSRTAHNFSENAPRLSVIMPVHNGGPFLRAALISILCQTYEDWELLLVDDGSSDGAFAAVRDLLHDPRIYLLRDGENRGLARRLNECIDRARGQFIARMDADDISYPRRFERQLALLEDDASIDLVACRCIRISTENEVVGLIPFAADHDELCRALWRGVHLAHPAWMGRTRWFRKHRYAEPAPYCCEDQELLVRAAPTSRYAAVPDVLFAYRVRDALPWRKTFRTRREKLATHLRLFYARGEVANAALALLAFAAATGRDAFQVLAKRAPHANGTGGEAAALKAEFDAVLRRLHADGRT